MKRFLAIGLLVCAACGSSSHPTSAPVTTVPVAITTTVPKITTTTVKPTDYKGQYLFLVAPLNAAVAKLVGQSGSIPDDIIQGVATATATFDTAILRLKWPANAISDIKDLVRATAAFSADVSQSNGQTNLSVAAFRSQLSRDSLADSTAANIVRADLGLPAPTS